ncbi:MAG: hypothetical protein QM477_05785 [Planctomycetota bacterium]
MKPRTLRFTFLLLLLAAAVSAPWWLGSGAEGNHFAKEEAADSVLAAGSKSDPLETSAALNLARELVVNTERADSGPRAPVATGDGTSRILLRLEDFGDMQDEWLRVEATEFGSGTVFRDRRKGDFLSLEVEPGDYRVSARIGDAPARGRLAIKSVVRLASSQLDYPSQQIRVLPGKVSEVVFRPLPAGSIFGTARRGREPVQGLHVILSSEASVLAITDANGNYRFEGVGIGQQEIHLGRPWIGVSGLAMVEADGEHQVDLQVPSSGFQITVKHEEFDIPLPGARVQIRFHPRRQLEDGPREGLAQGAQAEQVILLPTAATGQTMELLTGPGEVQYTVYGPQNYGLAGETGSFMVEESGIRKQEIGMRGGTEVTVRREGGQAGRMSLAYFVREDGAELGCGGIERLDDNTGYRVWGVPRARGTLYLTRTRAKRMWIAEVPASYEHQEVEAEEVPLVPIHVQSARYPDGRADYAVTLLAVHRNDGSEFPIGLVRELAFGLRNTSQKGMGLRPAEVTSLPAGSYTLFFKSRDHRVHAEKVTVDPNADKIVLNLVFQS